MSGQQSLTVDNIIISRSQLDESLTRYQTSIIISRSQLVSNSLSNKYPSYVLVYSLVASHSSRGNVASLVERCHVLTLCRSRFEKVVPVFRGHVSFTDGTLLVMIDTRIGTILTGK
jgi:hypothetical protein